MSQSSALQLGAFIRAHRERVTPEQAGLPFGLRRRAKGLRREELAALCDISPTWVTWIEQGRPAGVSAATLSRIAIALFLLPAERAYLFELAGLRDPDMTEAGVSEAMRAPLQEMLACIHAPAYVLDGLWQAIAWNTRAAKLFGGWLDTASPSRNLLDFVFLAPAARHLIVDWPTRARRLVAEFRADVSARLDSVAVAQLVDRLRVASTDFDMAWRSQDVMAREGGDRAFMHPSKGALHYRQVTTRIAHSPDLKLVILY
ncbi:MAG: helix-turn-helix domain-containing protein [Burkholderiales bacterium]|nr:helix-turn-helix domain-containing protein [Burkholderiales bacterium]